MSLSALANDQNYMAYLGSLENKYGLPTGLLATQQKHESNFDPEARSPAGAIGIAQFMPDTAKQYGINPLDPYESSDGQARMLSDLARKYNGDIPSVLAAYNWGSGNVDHKGLAGAPAETRNYISSVMGDLPGERPSVAETQDGGALSKIASTLSDAIVPQAHADELNPADLSEQDIAAELQRRGLAPAQQQQSPFDVLQNANTDAYRPAPVTPDLSDDQIKQELTARGLDQPKQSALRQLGLTARAGIEGLTAVPNIIGDAANAAINLGSMGINAVTGTKIPMLDYPGKTTQTALSQLGLPEPQTPIEKGVNFGASALASFGSPGNSILKAGAEEAAKVAGPTIEKIIGAVTPKTEQATYNIVKPNGQLASPSDKLIALKDVTPEQADAQLAKTKSPLPTSDDIRSLASQQYQIAEQKGGFLKPSFANKFVEESQNVMPQTVEGKIIAGETPATKLVERMQALKDKPISLKGAQEIDEYLGDEIDNFMENGKLTKQGKKLYDIQSEFRDMMTNAKKNNQIVGGKEGFEAWEKGQELWARQARMRDIEKIIVRSEGMANPAQGMRTGLNTMFANPSRMRGFTSAEKSLIDEARTSKFSDEALRVVGSRLGPIISGATGHLGGSLAGHVTSIAARGFAQKLQLYRMNKILEAIAKGTRKTKGVK